MSEVLLIAEIIRRYPQQWVLLGGLVGTDEPAVVMDGSQSSVAVHLETKTGAVRG